MAGAVLDPEALGDELADAWQCPEFGRKSCCQRAGHDELAQFALLFRIQLAWPSQVAALERFPAAFREPLLPRGHRLPRHTQLSRHFRFRQPARKELRPLQPPFLQRLEIPLVFHPCTPVQTQAD